MNEEIDIVSIDVTDFPEEEVLSEREREVRDSFVREYLVDHSSFKAAIRVGYCASVAQEYGKKLLQDSYVQRALARAEHTPNDSGETEEIRKQRVVNSLLKEANYIGPGASHSARVSALAKLASIHGLEAPSKTEIKHKGKVNHKHDGELSISHNVNFEALDGEELEMVRKLLENRIQGLEDANG